MEDSKREIEEAEHSGFSGYIDWDLNKKSVLTYEEHSELHRELLCEYARDYPDIYVTGHRIECVLELSEDADLTGAFTTHLDPDEQSPKLLSYRAVVGNDCYEEEFKRGEFPHIEYTNCLRELTLKQKKWIVCPDPKSHPDNCPFYHHRGADVVNITNIYEYVQCPKQATILYRKNKLKECDETCLFVHKKICEKRWCPRLFDETHDCYHPIICMFILNQGSDFWKTKFKEIFKRYYKYTPTESYNLRLGQLFERQHRTDIRKLELDLTRSESFEKIYNESTGRLQRETRVEINEKVKQLLMREGYLPEDRFNGIDLGTPDAIDQLIRQFDRDVGL